MTPITISSLYRPSANKQSALLSVDGRIAGLDPTIAKQIFSTRNYGTTVVGEPYSFERTGASFVRSVSCWGADFQDQLTAISTYDAYVNPAGNNRAKNRLTLITPRHVIAAAHYAGAGIGQYMTPGLSGSYLTNRVHTWIDADNNPHSAEALYYYQFGYDGVVLVLDQDIPASVHNMPIASSNFPSVYRYSDFKGPGGIPIISTNQFDELTISSCGEFFTDLPPTTYSFVNWTNPYTHSLRFNNYYRFPIPGDSSIPLMIIKDDILSIISTYFGTNAGPSLYLAEDLINDAIAKLDTITGVNTGYTVNVTQL